MDYLNEAKDIFAKTNHEPSEEDIKRLADNMALLEKRGLSTLNARLINNNKVKGIWNTIAELNLAKILVSQHDSSVPINYEPPDINPPPDFMVKIGDITYWIQMKDLSKLERENRQESMIQKIKAEAKKIKVSKFFSCKLSDGFKESNVQKLIEYIGEKALIANNEESFIFKDGNNKIAKIEFWFSGKKKLTGLKLCAYGDLASPDDFDMSPDDFKAMKKRVKKYLGLHDEPELMVNITGLNKKQIKRSLLKAAGAFNEIDSKNINLVVMEADGKEDIDICDALFGTEYGLPRDGWSSNNDGLFKEPDFSNKVAGIIVMKRKPEKIEFSKEEIKYYAKKFGMTSEEYRENAKQINRYTPISDYELILYVNDAFNHLLEDMKRLLCFGNIVFYNMRPPMGHGNFMQNIKMIIEFDGTRYRGWQSQKGGGTLQDELERCIKILAKEDIRVHSSGRTDAGVHARMMVANFHTDSERELDLEKFINSMNALLPDDIALLKVERISADFHSRRSAKRKTYEYHILNRFERSALLKGHSWHVRNPIDTDKMIEASKFLLGEHDFTSFASVGGSVKTHVRTLYDITIERDSEMVVVTCTGSGFLKQMVRNIVGLLVQVGLGKHEVRFVKEVLQKRLKEKPYVTAPAHGLFLKEVIY